MFTFLPLKSGRTNGHSAPLNFHPVDLFRQFDRAVNQFFDEYSAGQSTHSNNRGWNLNETDKEIVVSLDAPGFEAAEFDIQASEDSVTVVAEHVVREGDQARTERSFKREVSLPSLVDPNKVEAKYRNGVLELRFAKAELARWKKVEVKPE